jgi:hypothetical protein
VEARDTVAGDPIRTLSFPNGFDPRQVLSIPDLNANGSVEVGVLLAKADGADRMIVKDTLTKQWVQSLKSHPKYAGFDLHQVEVVAARNGKPAVAMLLHDPASGKTAAQVVDAATNGWVSTIAGYNVAYTPMKLVAVSDLTGNGIEEYAVLGRNPATGQVTAEIRDGHDAKRISRFWFNKDCTPLDMVSIADVNGNGAGELVMLGRCGADGKLRAFVKDAKTGALLRRLDF